MRIKEITHLNATYSDALNHSYIFNVAFRDDPMCLFLKPLYRFRGDLWRSLEGIQDPRQRLSELVAKAEAFRNLTTQRAWRTYKMLILPGTRTFYAYDDSDGALVGVATWSIPHKKYPKLSLRKRIVLWFKSQWATINLWLFQLLHGYNPMLDFQEGRQIFEKACHEFGIEDTPERENELKQAVHQQEDLKNSPYSRKHAYELVYFAVTRQGRGLGTSFLDEVLKRVESDIVPTEIDGVRVPSKAIILSTEAGSHLYSKFGFIVQKQFSHPAAEDNVASFKLMTKNY